MNHNNNDKKTNKNIKIKEFFKKEGFYVVLFLCLCLVAVAATIATRNNKGNASVDEPKEFSLDITENEEDKATNSSKDNAELVNENKDTSDKVNSNKDNTEVAASAKVTETILHYPVEGTLAREYQKPYITDAKDEARISSSIHVKVSENADIKSAGEGVVEEVVANDAVKGAYVTIKHTDGRYTRYSNLDANILVKKGDKVTKDTTIGKVGSTSKIYTNTPYEKDLEFELLRADGTQMDPTLIFKYTESN